MYETATPEDGYRVLVERLWPRGVSKDRAALDLWLPQIAPSTELRRWFGHDPARWPEFQARYRAELAANPEAVTRLREVLSQSERVTLVYAARDTAHNSAVVLRGYLGDAAAGQRA